MAALVPTDQKPTTELAPADLIAKAKEYARLSKAGSTIRTYKSVWKVFTAWCDGHGLEPMPATPETIVAYVADQGDRLRPQTVKKHLSAISQAHKMRGHPSPVLTEPVRMTLRGLSREKGTAPVQRKALRVEHIRRMVAKMPNSLVGVRDAAVILLGFVTGMRRSEITGLDVADVVFEPEGAVATIRRSKRDQEGKSRRVPVPLGGQHCPVAALHRWLDASGIQQGPLFIRLDPGAPRDRLGARTVASIVKRAATRAGLDGTMFSGHSLRRGFCTETARLGAAERDIARTTGHSSLAVLRGYVEAGTIFERAAARVLDL